MDGNIDSEKLVEKKLCEYTKNAGGYCMKVMTQFFNGFPDRMILLPGGIIFFVEVKTTKQKARKLQVHIHNKLKELGFDVYVIDRVVNAKKLIDDKSIK